VQAPTPPPQNNRNLAGIFHKEVTAWFVLVISLLITAFGWKIADNYVEQRARDRFQFEVSDARARIIKRMLDYEQVLRGGIALFKSADRPISRSNWHQYVSALQIHDYYPGIQGIGFARMLKPDELAAHIATIRAEGFPHYSVHPEGKRDTYSAIVFLEPFDWRNQRAFGYDMFSDPVRRAAMEQARDSGKPAVSGRVILVQETEEDVQPGFLMYLPLYRHGMPMDTVAQRRAALVGFVYSPFRVRDLMNGILGKVSPYLDFELYDGSEPQSPDTLLYDSNREQAPLAQASRYRAIGTIKLPGRTWTAHFRSRPSFDAAMSSNQPESIAIGGIIVDVLLFIVIWSLASEHRRVQRKAEAMTAKLREGTQRLQLAQKATKSGIWELDLVDNQLHWDERMYALYGIDPARFDNTDTAWQQYVHPNDLPTTLQALQQAIDGNGEFAAQFRIIRPDGQEVYLEANAVVQYSKQGKACRITGINRDITERKLDEERLRLAASVFHHAHEGIVITDARARIIDINPTFTTITGYSRDEVLGHTPALLRSGRHAKGFYVQLWHDLERDDYWRGEIWNRRKNGESFAELLTISTVRDQKGKISHYVGVFSDITRLKEQQSRLEMLAKYDSLTQLPNRVLLADRMQQARAQARRSGKQLAVCYLDLDNFKPVNDRLGHHAGDALLIEVAQRLNAHLRDSDSAARLGGDEFVLLLTQLNSTDEYQTALERLLYTLSQPYRLLDEHEVSISASIGVTLYPSDDADSDTLLRHADQAMYIAKQSGRNRYHLFDPVFDRLTQAHIEELSQIEAALDAGQFVLYYQPKVDMRRGEVIGLEALIRWQHPERGLLPPGEFLPLIENEPFSVQVGEWVIKRVLAQLSQWQSHGLRLAVSVNISGYHLEQPQFIERLRTLLGDYPDISSNQLELEVLETAALQDILLVSEVIKSCRMLGVSFSLDDFGTGYSSLTYLKRLPADTLKIDQTFVRDMLEDPEDLAIIEGIIGLSHAFHRQVIAEGVESLEHGALLLRLGCDLGQGYGIARPMPAEQVCEWVNSYTQPSVWSSASKIDWSRNDLPLLSAEIEHRRWVDDLIASITAGTEVLAPPELDYTQCNFSKWYEGIGRDDYGHLEEFRELDTIHRRVHELGRELVELDRSGRNDIAIKRLPQLRELRTRVQEHLLMLKTAVVNDVLRKTP
jgi:diguanylate cyclase (GGDEF)-like protein/PAS domain S-box-containing protein